MERGRRHMCKRARVTVSCPWVRTVAVARAEALATIDLWDALASFAEGGMVPSGWAAGSRLRWARSAPSLEWWASP
ncbi:hypothetical protein FOA52_005867 [Chlamydomonas sp. UWO 241]|nr:hypothetical protein FOA52_005867 [Chlamydomonas sp. UWO 241]